jgi:hypothetical protein
MRWQRRKEAFLPGAWTRPAGCLRCVIGMSVMRLCWAFTHASLLAAAFCKADPF